jgi:hypothetical protein
MSYEPTVEDLCAGAGHKYYGDDAGYGRCYCGTIEYPVGGPQEPAKGEPWDFGPEDGEMIVQATTEGVQITDLKTGVTTHTPYDQGGTSA